MLEIHFIARGRVDTILVGCDGEWLFIDGGYRKDGLAAIAYMKNLGVTKLKYYIASHGHKNHVGAAAPIIKELKPDVVYIPRTQVAPAIKKYAKGNLEQDAVEDVKYEVLHVGQWISLGESVLTCLAPKSFRACSCGAYGENYNSMVLRLEYLGRTVLFTGDTSDGILGKAEGIQSEVYKNHHHNGATGKAVLKKIAPRYVVVCNGKAPGAAYKKSVKAMKAEMYVAGNGKGSNGNVVMRTDGDGWTVSVDK